MNKPIASVITPTFGREWVLPTIYRCFNKQTVTDIEWLVLDDSPQPSKFMQSIQDPRVRYEYLDKRITIGEKRNWLVDKSRSDVIVHFDDDDYYSPIYIETMLSKMREGQADFIKLSGFFLYSVVYKKIWFLGLNAKDRFPF